MVLLCGKKGFSVFLEEVLFHRQGLCLTKLADFSLTDQMVNVFTS